MQQYRTVTGDDQSMKDHGITDADAVWPMAIRTTPIELGVKRKWDSLMTPRRDARSRRACALGSAHCDSLTPSAGRHSTWTWSGMQGSQGLTGRVYCTAERFVWRKLALMGCHDLRHLMNVRCSMWVLGTRMCRYAWGSRMLQ